MLLKRDDYRLNRQDSTEVSIASLLLMKAPTDEEQLRETTRNINKIIKEGDPTIYLTREEQLSEGYISLDQLY